MDMGTARVSRPCSIYISANVSGIVDLRPARVFLSDDLSSDKTTINIHTQSTLFAFHARRTGEWVIKPSHSLPCKTAMSVHATRHDAHDTLILDNDGRIHLHISGRVIALSLPRSVVDIGHELPRQLASRLSMTLDADVDMDKEGYHRARHVTGLRDPVEGRVTVDFDDSESLSVSVDFRIKDQLVRRCYDAIAWLVSSDLAFRIRVELLQALQNRQERPPWDLFVVTIKSILGVPARASAASSLLASAQKSSDPTVAKLVARLGGLRSDAPADTVTPALAAEEVAPDSAAFALLALHLVAQDCRLSQSRRKELELVSQLVIDIAAAIGRRDWVDYWKRCMPESVLSIVSASDCECSLYEWYCPDTSLPRYVCSRCPRGTT